MVRASNIYPKYGTIHSPCFRKIDQPAQLVPKPKHPYSVHVWAGISSNGATNICIFEGIMDAVLYTEILENYLLPFISNLMPNHRFMQDNDPKAYSSHISAMVGEDFVTLATGLRYMRTPMNYIGDQIAENKIVCLLQSF